MRFGSAQRRERAKATSKRERRTTRAPRSRERLDVDERRAQLLKLGIDLFANATYDEVSIDELARAAGVSKGLLYHYFPTKRDFYVATVREAARDLAARTDISPSLPPLERMRAGLDAYLDYVGEHAAAYAALMRGGIGADPEVARIIDETRALFVDRLLAGLPDLAPPTPLLRAAARGYVGFCEATVLGWIDDRSIDRETLRDLIIEVLLATIGVVARDAAAKDKDKEKAKR